MELSEIQELRKKIRVLEREIGSALDAQSCCCGVTLAQCHILLELESNNEISMKDLSESMELDKSTMSRSIDGMVKQQFVHRAIDPEDRRYMKISLTEKGKRIAGSINTMCNDYYEKLFGMIPENKRGQVADSIGILADAMTEFRKPGNRAEKDCCGG
jgi:DNA-binding MarR family transcriptional regulator